MAERGRPWSLAPAPPRQNLDVWLGGQTAVGGSLGNLVGGS
jgi:hypothetical protein